MNTTQIILALVTIERLAELWLARRNTTALLRQGALEVAAAHYGLIVGLHALWLAGLWWFGWAQPVNGIWLAMFVILQLGRIWVLSTLGARWTTRIIILPDAPLIASGPYRYIAHPNYLIVIGEIAVLPLALGLPVFAAVFSVVNAMVLSIRVRAENAALRRFERVT